MQWLDSFLRRHQIDVGRSFALLFFWSALHRAYGSLSGIRNGEYTVDAVLTLVFLCLGVGLWKHKSWCRKLLLGLGWPLLILIELFTVAIISGVMTKLSFVFESVRIVDAGRLQAAIWSAFVIPSFLAALALLHSKKAREECARIAVKTKQGAGS